MKKYNLSVWITFLLTLGIFIGASCSIDTARDNVWAADQEKVQEKTPVDKGRPLPGPDAAVPELPTDKHVAVPPPEAASTQQSKDVLSSAPPDNKQGPVISSGISRQTKDAESSVDTSYKSNETALKAIEKNVTLFKDRIKERFSIWLERSARYIDIMKEVLKEKELPEELVFLPIIESGFNLNAYSRAKAVGPWQFIASTGKRYGLVIDWWRDERKDPVKSTKAAADYLKDLYKMFGSWNLALAAYNAGEGRIQKALKRSDTDDYWALLNTKQIRSETKEYVPRYIAATMIANTPEEYGFNNLDYHEPLEYDEITVHSPLDIEIIAKCSEATVKEIRELNPELRRWSTPPNVAQYTIRIPSGSKEIFQQNLSAIPKENRFTVGIYTAKRGDTVKKIAKKTGLPVNAILAMNSLNGVERFHAGDEVKIPPKEKFSLDLDDKAVVRKVSYKKKATADKKRTGKKGKGKKGKGKKGSSKKSYKGKSRVKTKKA